MAYKRNPMRCERACGLARFVMGLVNDPLQTHATQWLERTLDDSSNRRLVLPEAFLALDGALDIMANVAEGLVVWEATVAANLAAELPFMASEGIMLEATRTGADRQEAHEAIRVHSMAAAEEVKKHGKPNDLMARLRKDPFFSKVDLDGALDPARHIGRAPEQTDRFIATVIEPIRARYAAALATKAELRV
jgi:adenylosuccinate lyase